ncbi:MAG: RnfABCDGE type electron transport complex subunit B [Clostridia bacterium]|nr:RnfABCDGE type electron transport complex subunit B [Clostridia bacterium]
MNPIAIAVIFVGAVGLVCGAAIVVLSKFFAVPADEKAEEIEALLPGANCGACGFSGCSGYASALSKGETEKVNLCKPGGQDVADAVSALLGKESAAVETVVAVVRCRGWNGVAVKKHKYDGISSCRLASQLYGGEKACPNGCLGLGDCVDACPFGAIYVSDKGVARVDPDKCRACGICVDTCPKKLIDLLPAERAAAAVLCRNTQKGAQTRKACANGCIGCMKCQKACETGAVKVTDFCAEVDFSLCTGCGKCEEVCPTGAIAVRGLLPANQVRIMKDEG